MLAAGSRLSFEDILRDPDIRPAMRGRCRLVVVGDCPHIDLDVYARVPASRNASLGAPNLRYHLEPINEVVVVSVLILKSCLLSFICFEASFSLCNPS